MARLRDFDAGERVSGVSAMRGRVLRAIGAEGIGQLLNISIRLLLVPLYLWAWGVEVYGEWLILTALAGLFGLADLGGQLYFINRMTEAWTKRQLDEFQNVFSTGMFFLIISSSILLILAAFALSIPGIPVWLGIKSTDSEVVYWVMLVMCFRMLASLPLGLLLGVFRATGAQATSVMYGNLMLLFQLISASAVLILEGGMVLMALTEVIGLFLVSMLVVFDLRRRLPTEMRLVCMHRPQMNILRLAWGPSLHFLAIQLAMATLIQGSVIVVAKVMGPSEVAIFSTMRTVTNLVTRLLGMLSHSAWPEFTRLNSNGEGNQLQSLFRTILNTSTLMGLLYVGAVELFGSQIFDVWLGNHLLYDSSAMYMMGALVVFTCQWTIGGNLLMATNQHSEYARVQLPVNFFALSLSYYGGLNFGLIGFVGGLLLGQSFVMIFFTAWILTKKSWVKASQSMLANFVFSIIFLTLFYIVIARDAEINLIFFLW